MDRRTFFRSMGFFATRMPLTRWRGALAAACVVALTACALSSYAGPELIRVGDREDRGELADREITEASGIAASRRNPGVFWVHNDSGDIARVFAVGSDGGARGIVHLQGCPARDWEDIAAGPGPVQGESYLYIGDIGDNLGIWPTVVICRVVEPQLAAGNSMTTLEHVEVFRIAFPDGSHNAETLMVDPLTNDLYIVTKEDQRARVYRAPQPLDSQQRNVLELVAELPLSLLTAGDIAPDGSGILLKNMGNIWFWQRNPGQSIASALAAPARRVRYVREPQGEAVAWTADGQGYVTVSERAFGLLPHLYFYPVLP